MSGFDSGAAIAAEHGLKRSDKWPEVEHQFLADHPGCAACDATTIQVHHVLPFHFAILLGRPDLELDPRNLIGLCESEKGKGTQNHHLLLGHLDDFRSYNRDVRAFATTFHGAGEQYIKANTDWVTAAHNKPPVWADMTDIDKAQLRQLMDDWYPIGSPDSNNP